ncbi:hypothetical protein CAURIC_10650 [Corynebacterium auriscanis]|nr:hypothetical protein CAURIC_10650 [Corynebacterium auriscanis]
MICCTSTGGPCCPGGNYLTERQNRRLDLLWATDDEYAALEVTWMFYQDMI